MQTIRKSHTVRKAEILRFWDVNIPCQVSKHTLPFIFRYFAIYVNILFGALRRTLSSPFDCVVTTSGNKE